MYEVHFKKASLRQIFSGAARRSNEECSEQVINIIEAAEPDTLVMGIDHAPRVLVWHKIDTPAPGEDLKAKLLALPFVEKIESEEEMNSRVKGKNLIKGRISGLLQRIIY